MFDFKFNWDKSIEIGIPIIDDQHKELFRIGRRIDQILLINLTGVNDDQLLSIVCELRDYITYHFYYEEAFMHDINYPNFLSHKNSHDNFKSIINTIDYDNLYSSLKSLKELITMWVFEHILVDDYALKPFINI